MSVQVYIEGNQIVLDSGNQKQFLNLSQSQKLAQEMLVANQRLQQLEEDKHKEIVSLRSQLAYFRRLHPLSADQKSEISSFWNCGEIAKGQKILESTGLGGVAWFFDLDLQGWAVLEGGLEESGSIALCFALSQLPTEHFLHKLWSWGAFDIALVEAVGSVSSSQIPSPLLMRLFPMLAQECWIPAGKFQMGYDGYACLPCEYPVREVEILQGYYVSRFPVTQLLYWLISDAEPSTFIGASRPVESVSWFDAILFCNAYSKAMGLSPCYRIEGAEVEMIENTDGYRLLTEAEWECAARAWSPYFFSGSDDPHRVAWFSENSDEQTHVIGRLSPNKAQVYDMTGNVWEWVWDWYHETFYSYGADSDPTGPTSGRYRCCRGGGFRSSGESARISIRGSFEPVIKRSSLGFRIARRLV